MLNQLNFYMNPRSRARIVRWMLEEVGTPYETHVIEYGAQMKSEPFLSINPMGKVPAIAHNGKVVTESAAICAYLADAFPEANLAPAITDRADYYRWLFFAAGPLESAITNKALGFDVPQDKQVMSGYGNFKLTVETLRKAISQSDYVAGSQFTSADVYVGSQVGWGLQFKTLPKHSEFFDYFERLSSRPAYQRAQQLDDSLLSSPGSTMSDSV